MNQSIKFKCVYCSRSYKRKDNYDKHVTGCELFHHAQLAHPDAFTNEIETVPDIRQLYIYIRELASKCANLENEVAQLKQHANIRQKKQIIEWLNVNRPIHMCFINWIKTRIHTLSYETLDIVFKNDLTEGIYHTLQSIISKTIPLAAFTQKPNYLYIYSDSDGEGSWRGMTTEDLEKMVFYISQQFLIAFVKWQKENSDRISKSEKLKDDEIMYMIKINGSKISMEKRCTEIKKRLYSLLEENLELCEFV